MPLATLSIDIEAKLAKLEEGMEKAARISEKNAALIQARWQRIGAVTAGLGATIASAFAGFTVVSFIKGNADAIDALNDVRDATGASIENISGLEQVALRTGGTLEDVSGILIKFNKNLGEANPNSPISLALKSIGLNAAELRKMDPAEALRVTAVALSGFADDGTKARIVQDLFGKSVKEAAPFLNDLAEAGKLNGRVTTEQAAEAEKFNKQMFEMQTKVANTARELASTLIPALNNLFDLKKRKGLGGGLLDLLGFDDGFFDTKAMYDVAAPVIAAKKQLDSARSTLATFNDALARDARAGAPENRAYVQARDQAQADLTRAEAMLARAKKVFNDADAVRKEAARRKAMADDKASYDPLEKPTLTRSDSQSEAAILQEQKRYEDLTKKIKERLAVAQAELSIGTRLTESDKLRLDVLAELDSAKLSEPHKARAKALLDEAIAAIKAREGQELELKTRTEIARMTERLAAAQTQRIEGLITETQSMREANEEIGLSILQVEALRIKRMEDALATEEQAYAMALNAEASDAEAQSMAQSITLLKERIQLRKDAASKAEDIARDPYKGASDSLQAYLEQVAKSGDATRDAVSRGLAGAEDVLTEFFATGKLNARSFADSVIAEIMRIQIVRPLAAGAAAAIGNMFGGSVVPASPYWAKGGVFGPAGNIKAFANGDVFAQPTAFQYGAGQLGVMGEAGPEAVMPLKRGNDGKLGVAVRGGSAAPPQTNHYWTVNGDVSPQTIQLMKSMLEQHSRAQMRSKRTGGAWA